MSDKVTTLEEAMADDRAGSRWTVFARYTGAAMVPVPDKPGAVRLDPNAAADYYGVAHRTNWSIERGRFKTSEEATACADEFNRLDVQGPIPAEFVDRRNRLKELAPYFRHWAYTSDEGPPGARWPVNPDRYLIFDAGVGWHPEDWEYLVPDRAAIEEHLGDNEANVYRIVDLDTGLDVPFKREISASVDPADSL